MHCAYICCLAFYITTAVAVVNHGEAPQYTIAPAVEQLQQQKQQQQQALHFLNQQSLPGNNNYFAASAAHPTDPATSPHFLTGYSYIVPPAITTIRPPITALTTTIVPTVTTAPTQAISADYIYNAPMSEGYNNHAYYAPYNQPNYQTAALTAHTNAEPSLSFTPNYYVPQSATANSEANRQEASNFYAGPQLPNKTEALQAPSQEQSLQQESTSQQVIPVYANDNNNAQQTQTLTPYQRIFREFADYLLWKRAQAKQQKQIQNSQQADFDFADAQPQFEFIAPSAGATQTGSRPYQVSQSSPIVSLPQATEAPTRNVDTLQRPIGAQRPLISGEDHVAYLSKPSESWELPSLECEKANKQLQAIFNEQRPLSSGLNRGQYEETSYKQHQHAAMEPGTWQGGEQSQEFEWRKQQQLQEQQQVLQQQALQHQKLQQLQGVQDQSHQQQLSETQYQQLNLRQQQQQQQYQKQQQNNLQQQQNLQQFQQQLQEQSIQQQQHQKQQQNNLQQQQKLQQQLQEQSIQKQKHQKQQQKYNLQHQQRQQKQQQVQEQKLQLEEVQQLQGVQQELLQQSQKEEQYNLQQEQYKSQQQQPKQQYHYQHPEQQQKQQQQQEYTPQQQNHLQQQLQQKLQQTNAYPPTDLTQQQTAGLGDEGHAQKSHWPPNAALHVQQLPQPQQGHPLPQSIHASASEPNQAAQTQAPIIQQTGTAFTPPSLGNQLAQQQPLLYAHTLKQTLEATTPAAFLQSSQLTRLPTQSAQINLPTSYNSNAYFNSYARQLRRPHATYGVPL